MTSSETDYVIQRLDVIEWEHLDLRKFYPLAMLSSWSVRCMLYPMSVVKSRLQLQRQTEVYRGMRHAFADIFRREGVGALYRGFWITLPQIATSFIYSSVYERLRDLFQIHAGIRNTAAVSALAGGAASMCTQLVFVPTDIIAQHMMVHNNPKFFGSTKNVGVMMALRNDGLTNRATLGLRVVRAVYQVDGFRGFYRGFLSSLMLYIPSSMVFWTTYYSVLDTIKTVRRNKGLSEQPPSHYYLHQGLAGSIGGCTAAVCTNPLEILRIRLQVHRTTYRETVRRLWLYEGFSVFTKGLAPRLVSNSIYSGLIMIGYETVKKLSVLPEHANRVVW